MENRTNRLLSLLLPSSEYQPESNDYEAVSKMALTSRCATDTLLIQTVDSTYRAGSEKSSLGDRSGHFPVSSARRQRSED